jgi:hypothetical protein
MFPCDSNARPSLNSFLASGDDGITSTGVVVVSVAAVAVAVAAAAASSSAAATAIKGFVVTTAITDPLICCNISRRLGVVDDEDCDDDVQAKQDGV